MDFTKVLTSLFDKICIFFFLCSVVFIFIRTKHMNKVLTIIICIGMSVSFAVFSRARTIQELLSITYTWWIILGGIYFTIKKPSNLERWQVIFLTFSSLCICAIVTYLFL